MNKTHSRPNKLVYVKGNKNKISNKKMSKQGILCMFAYSDVQQFVLSTVFTFGVPCCGLLYALGIKAIFDTSSCVFMSYFRYLCLFVSSTLIYGFWLSLWYLQTLLCIVFVLCLVYQMLSVSLDCQLLIAPFSNVYLKWPTQIYNNNNNNKSDKNN